VLTFDCYGTLIDWETGLLQSLHRVLDVHAVAHDDDSLLEAYATHEAALEAGPYLTYKDVIAGALRALSRDLGFAPSEAELRAFSRSPGEWPAFADSATALARLQERFGLAVITNCDDDLFAASQARLGIEFEWVITAQQARSYKPDLRNFELAFDVIGAPRERILHVAQSLYHDHVPAKHLGMTTVWVNRRHERGGFGATPRAEATPDLIVPDLQSLARLAAAAQPRQ
jgi:2-haloacid dehalogenase